MAILKIKSLNLSYLVKGEFFQVLRNVDLAINEGEIVCLWGRSGCGKSSLLRAIAGLEKITEGDISLFGKKLSTTKRNAPLERAKLGMNLVFQDNALISNQSVENNLKLPLIYKNEVSQEIINEQTEKIMTSMLIQETRSSFPHELSLGVQKRVGIARALISEPRVLLMDEPTAGLDHSSKTSLLALLYNYQILNKLSVIMVTHDLDIALSLNAKVAYLNDQGHLYPPQKFAQLEKINDPFLQQAILELNSDS